MFLITAIFWCGREHERLVYCIILMLSLHYQTDFYTLSWHSWCRLAINFSINSELFGSQANRSKWRTLQDNFNKWKKKKKKKRREHQLLMIDYKSYYLSGRTTWLIKTGKMKSYAYLQMQHIFFLWLCIYII